LGDLEIRDLRPSGLARALGVPERHQAMLPKAAAVNGLAAVQPTVVLRW